MTARQKQFRSLGKKPMVVLIYDSGEPPAMYEETFGSGLTCSGKQYAPFPELNGGYRQPAPAKPG
jgi:hypothetical protein